ncbi:glycoside hydrolase family 108 protein [Methylobacterium sp. Leaf88]|uniref:glycoside hydrolase family 108 protein n=1 Tax=Methylobacterium sp. Leaf88 TaxID=1736244 RepID=UPI0009EB8BCF|nr:glycoside hydrolase family 108 protein [Methylobacterium sp. Leaf88]
MAADNFSRAFPLTLKHEGGWVDHPADPGGATNLGVTIGTLSSWLGRPASKAEVKALTRESVAPIYRKNYWDAIRGDELPAGLDYAVFDFAVNSGPKRAAMALQRAVGVADDGVIGSITLANVANRPVDSTIEHIMADRMTFLRQLSTWPTFGKGWTARCDGVLREALNMAASAPLPVPPVTVAPIPVPAGPLVAPAPRNSGVILAPAPRADAPATVPAPEPGFWGALADRFRTAFPLKKG